MALAFWRRAEADPAWTALVEPDGTQRTAGELLTRVNQLTHALRGLGLRPGDGIAVLLPNGGAALEIYLAALQGGWYYTPVNWHFTPPEIAYIVADSEAKAFFVHERHGGAGAAAADLAGLPAGARFSYGTVPGFMPVADLLAGQPDTLPGDRVAGSTMHYTSGTTGRPKGVRRDLPGIDPDEAAETTTALLQIFGVPPGQPHVHLVTSPNYHTAVTLFGGAAIHLGHTLVYMDGWDSETALALRAAVPGDQHAHGAHPVQADAVAAGIHPARVRPVVHALDHPRRGPVPGAAQAGHAGLVGAAGVRVLRGDRGRRHAGHPAGLAGPPGHGGPGVAAERDHDR